MLEFRHTSDGHYKFWEIEETGPLTVEVRWGAIGSIGQAQQKRFATPAEAADFIEKKVNEKLAKGYRQV